MKNDFYETELKKVQKCCNKYGYHAFLRFDELHIRSKFESWYFIPNEFGGMKVMHWNGFNTFKENSPASIGTPLKNCFCILYIVS